MKIYDVVLLTEQRYESPKEVNNYIQNILTEDGLVEKALEKLGCNVYRTSWDNKKFDWSTTHLAIFRTTWDYFYRFDEFKKWLNKVKEKTTLINPYHQILWNLDKHYLLDLQKQGINIPASYYIPKGTSASLKEIHEKCGWKKTVLKPTISGAARHTYKLDANSLNDIEADFSKLIKKEDFMLQEFQENIINKGEVALMLFGGEYSHSILKKAKSGDFRVQDDFGGTVENYIPSSSEIKFAEDTVKCMDPVPDYARVDMIWDNNNEPAVSELELIEPELWFRFNPKSADHQAKHIYKKLCLLKS